MATIPEKAAILMEHLVTHDGNGGHGYSQYSRNGDGSIEIVRIDGQDVEIAGGDRDCSSACISCYEALGVDCGGATYTGNMRSCMVKSGNFVWKPMSWSARTGDIYLNEENHAAMCISPYGSARGDLLAQFSISEKGTVDGKEGDQTGRESNIKPYYNYPWDGKLHYVGEGGSSKPSTGGSSSSGKAKWQTAYGDPNWWGPKMCRGVQGQLGTPVDGYLGGQAKSNKTYFWAVDGGVKYGSSGSTAVRRLQQGLIAAGYSCGSSGVDGHYGRDTIRAHQRWLKAEGYYTGEIDGYHGTATNCAVCMALADGAYERL